MWPEGLLEHPLKGEGGEGKLCRLEAEAGGPGAGEAPGAPPSQLWILGSTWKPKTQLVGRAPAHVSAEDGQSWIGGQGDERVTGGLDAQEAVGKEGKSRDQSGHPPPTQSSPGTRLCSEHFAGNNTFTPQKSL